LRKFEAINEKYDLVMELFSYSPHVKVLRPESLADEILRTHIKTLNWGNCGSCGSCGSCGRFEAIKPGR